MLCRPAASTSASWSCTALEVLRIKLCRTQAAFTQASTFAGPMPITQWYMQPNGTQWHKYTKCVFNN
uniref:Uncharacterized protein n=1 Tax=Anguilla anguilla TaxID=7936 RepID=A0A0E9SV34_ANGAN